MQNDIHATRGLACVSCHGGDKTQSDEKRAMNPAAGFIGRPAPAAIAAFCGKCHSNAEFMRTYNPAPRIDQEAEYKTSGHSKLIVAGDSRPATCISCHGTHGIRAARDTSSPVYPTRVAETCGRCHEQLADYTKSVHAEALLKKFDISAPTCNDCHGNHGAVPPGAASVANVCGTCHVRQSELFQKSPHQPVFEGLGLPECLACHDNHNTAHPTDEMLGNDEKAVCTMCHSEGAGFEAAGRMRRSVDTLSERIGTADPVLDRGIRLGMEVSREKFELNEARNHLIDARVLVHSFSADELDRAVTPGVEIADRVHQRGLQALEEAAFRRRGLGLSLILIGLAIVAIYLKIRDIEKRSA
jgi:predicted CXXCH cytochrome family protein